MAAQLALGRHPGALGEGLTRLQRQVVEGPLALLDRQRLQADDVDALDEDGLVLGHAHHQVDPVLGARDHLRAHHLGVIVAARLVEALDAALVGFPDQRVEVPLGSEGEGAGLGGEDLLLDRLRGEAVVALDLQAVNHRGVAVLAAGTSQDHHREPHEPAHRDASAVDHPRGTCAHRAEPQGKT